MLNSNENKRITPLHLAYKNKKYEIITELIKIGANPFFANSATHHVPYLAALHDDEEALKALLEGANEGGDEAKNNFLKAKKYRNSDRMLAGIVTEKDNMIRVSIFD